MKKSFELFKEYITTKNEVSDSEYRHIEDLISGKNYEDLMYYYSTYLVSFLSYIGFEFIESYDENKRYFVIIYHYDVVDDVYNGYDIIEGIRICLKIIEEDENIYRGNQ